MSHLNLLKKGNKQLFDTMICTVCQAKAKVEIKNFLTSIEHKRCFKKNLFCNGCAHKAVIHKTLGRINGSPIELVTLDHANESGQLSSLITNLSQSEVVPSALNQKSISSGCSSSSSGISIIEEKIDEPMSHFNLL